MSLYGVPLRRESTDRQQSMQSVVDRRVDGRSRDRIEAVHFPNGCLEIDVEEDEDRENEDQEGQCEGRHHGHRRQNGGDIEDEPAQQLRSVRVRRGERAYAMAKAVVPISILSMLVTSRVRRLRT